MRDTRSLSGLVFRNSVMNVVTQGLLMVLAFGCLPILAHGLSKNDFGLLTLLWAVVGHFSILDLGVSRAITKFTAEAIGKGDTREVRRMLWVSLMFSFVVGIAACLLLALATPLLVQKVFPIPEADRHAASTAFLIASLGIPLTLLTGTIRGLQMAYQRFGLVNLTQALNGVIQWGGAAILIWTGSGLIGVVAVTVIARVIAFVIAGASLPFLVPGLFSSIELWHTPTARRLLSFGGWVTMSLAVTPLFQYVDRVFIGIFLSMGAVGFYAVPQEALIRLLVLPLSLTLTLFPALSYMVARESMDSGSLYERPLKLFTISLFPVTLILVVFARDILFLWLGKEFADADTLVFQIMAVGIFYCMVGQVPATMLHAFGRPDLSAKFNLAELPLMVVLNLVLIPVLGIVGAAVSWSVRIIVDALLVFWIAQRLLGARQPGKEFAWVWKSLAAQGFVGIAAIGLPLWVPGLVQRSAIVGVLCVLFLAAAWTYWLDAQDREFVLRLRRSPSAA